jgi:hypothetical protein
MKLLADVEVSMHILFSVLIFINSGFILNTFRRLGENKVKPFSDSQYSAAVSPHASIRLPYLQMSDF